MSEELRSWLIMAACEYLSTQPNHNNGFCYWCKQWILDEAEKPELLKATRVYAVVEDFRDSTVEYHNNAYCVYDSQGRPVEGCVPERLIFVERFLAWLLKG